MTNQNPVPRSGTLTGVRRAAVVFVIVSLSIAALLGIVTLFTGEFGEIQAKVLLTTLLTAGFAITSLCHLAVVGRALRLVGFVGIAASFGALILGLVLIWASWDNWSDGWDTTLKAFLVLSIVAASLAQANLLLLLASRQQTVIRVGLIITLVAVALVALLVTLTIVSDGEIPGRDGDLYWRVVGVVAILDVLGTIVLPVLGRVLRDGSSALTLRFDGELAARLRARADAEHITPAEVVERLLANERTD
ncbi:hypothetical protein M2152_001424 [Microbacteriaceae bacterium SG_E_30_P1]|uniref:Uncharacterized protein n=1 Tax=Antiquaquibacter oligotrophicus TaxID=2880260 RepID=A0ABT6KQ60_9MICO|nr:hypothetical protein [Antiquaquibacter oligotrophicus]MDH6181242.1 hypothetical protein [Antiquaquibacter oligotrophicus]UDF13063.1 hypothetical protein LH407_13015 [Antiquaquibacter oligotrophicus]